MKLKKWAALLVILSIMVWQVPAQAVVKEIMVSGDGGKPVPNTKISIFNEEGKEIGQKETDDKGILVYDFPKGKNTLQWPGGSQIVDIPGFWTAGNTALVTGIALGGVGVAALSSRGGGGGGSSSSSSSSTTNSSVPAPGEINGSYTLSGNKIAGTCSGSSSTISNSSVPISTDNGSLTIKSSRDIRGTYNQSTGAFSGSGSGSGLTESFNGTFTKNGKVQASGTLLFDNSNCFDKYNATYSKN